MRKKGGWEREKEEGVHVGGTTPNLSALQLTVRQFVEDAGVAFSSMNTALPVGRVTAQLQ